LTGNAIWKRICTIVCAEAGSHECEFTGKGNTVAAGPVSLLVPDDIAANGLCQPTPVPLARAGFKFNLGDLYPNGRVDVRMTIRAPRQYQAGNIPGMNVGVNFTYTYFYQNVQTAEMPAGDLVFSLSQSGGTTFFRMGN